MKLKRLVVANRQEIAIDELDEADIANARVNDMAPLWNHPQLAARTRWRKVITARGEVDALPPPRLDHARMALVPTPGQYTEQVFNEFGF